MSSESQSPVEPAVTLKPRDDGLPDGADRVLTEPRYQLVTNILGHPQQSVSVPEFEFMNPSMSESSIRYHLGELVDDGVVEKVSLSSGERVSGAPYTFYEFTDEGVDVLELSDLQSRKEAFSDLYHVVVKPDRVLDIEEMQRP